MDITRTPPTPQQAQWVEDFIHGDSVTATHRDGVDVIVEHEDGTRTRITPDGTTTDEPALVRSYCPTCGAEGADESCIEDGKLIDDHAERGPEVVA